MFSSSEQVKKLEPTYNQIHAAIKHLAPSVTDWAPDWIIAIGGGGYIPSRIMRTFVKKPVLAVSVKLYDDDTNKPGECVVVRQWLRGETIEKLKGSRILIVDEVDDTRTTLAWVAQKISEECAPSALACAVLFNKRKRKEASLPNDCKYFCYKTIGDVWLEVPWDQLDIEETL